MKYRGGGRHYKTKQRLCGRFVHRDCESRTSASNESSNEYTNDEHRLTSKESRGRYTCRDCCKMHKPNVAKSSESEPVKSVKTKLRVSIPYNNTINVWQPRTLQMLRKDISPKGRIPCESQMQTTESEMPRTLIRRALLGAHGREDVLPRELLTDAKMSYTVSMSYKTKTLVK